MRMLHIRRLALLLPLIVLASACGRPERVETITAWEKIYDRPADSATAIEMFDDQYGLAIIGHGIERTTDGGRTWHETDSADDFIGPIAIADRDHAWVGGAGDVILRTEDGGQTWTAQPTGTQAPVGSISAVSEGEAWAAGYVQGVQGFPPHGVSALLHTTDGRTWRSVEVPGYGIFMGVWFVGSDGWLLATQCHPGDPLDDPNAELGAPGHLPCNDQLTMLHTTDDGATWTSLPRWDAWPPAQVVRADRLVGYVVVGACPSGCSGLRVSRTSDGGATWADIGPPGVGANGGIWGVRLSDLDGWVGVTQLDPPTVPPSAPRFVSRLAHTGDGGATWSYMDLPEGACPCAFDLSAGHLLASVGDTGISIYDPGIGTWRPSDTDAGPDLTRFVFTTTDHGYGSIRGGGVWATDDGGETWAPSSSPPQLVRATTGGFWYSDADHTLHVSGDGETAWRAVAPPPPARATTGPLDMSVDLISGDRVLVTLPGGLWSFDGGLWETADLGATWRHLDVEIGGTYQFLDELHGWALPCTRDDCAAVLRITSDGGETWTSFPLPADIYVGWFVTPNDGWGMVLQKDADGRFVDCRCRAVTHDGGRSWQTVSTAPWSLGQVLPIDGQRAFAVGVTGLSLDVPPDVLSTFDGGATWQKEFSLGTYGMTPLTSRDGRVWLLLSTATFDAGGLDIPSLSPRRTIIYRRDVAPAPPPATPAGVSP